MNSNFVIMGLPASGKTTFLAALWHLIEADETECRLKLSRYVGDLTYLNSIAEDWRSFRKVRRTSQVGDVDVTIHLIDSMSAMNGRAFFPDIAGETFDTQVEARRCRPSFVSNLDSDDGILLFISVNSKQDSLSVIELTSMMPPDSDQGVLEIGDASATSLVGAIAELDAMGIPVDEWQPAKLPAQVRLVQMLSDLLRPPFSPRTRKLAVMLSAWDLVSSTGMSPDQWLQSNMPLVDQFLRTNGQFFSCRIYGVSAQGVSLDNMEAVDNAALLAPSHRISIVGPTASGHDITAPLVWLMSVD